MKSRSRGSSHVPFLSIQCSLFGGPTEKPLRISWLFQLTKNLSCECQFLISPHSSLLKNFIAELYWKEKHRKSHLSNTNSQYFDRKTCRFAFLKTHQLTFSTG